REAPDPARASSTSSSEMTSEFVPRSSFLVLLRLEFQRQAVHAVAKARRVRTIGKHVTEMAATPAAVHFDSLHEQTAIDCLAHGLVDGLRKTRPAGPALIFCVGQEQRLPATRTDECALAFLCVQRTGSTRLGSVMTQHFELLRCQVTFPL